MDGQDVLNSMMLMSNLATKASASASPNLFYLHYNQSYQTQAGSISKLLHHNFQQS